MEERDREIAFVAMLLFDEFGEVIVSQKWEGVNGMEGEEGEWLEGARLLQKQRQEQGPSSSSSL